MALPLEKISRCGKWRIRESEDDLYLEVNHEVEPEELWDEVMVNPSMDDLADLEKLLENHLGGYDG